MASAHIHPDSTTVWERIWSSPLRREITIALVAKVVALSAVWAVFFSEPLDRDLDHRAVEQALLAPGSPAAIVPATKPDQREVVRE